MAATSDHREVEPRAGGRIGSRPGRIHLRAAQGTLETSCDREAVDAAQGRTVRLAFKVSYREQGQEEEIIGITHYTRCTLEEANWIIEQLAEQIEAHLHPLRS